MNGKLRRNYRRNRLEDTADAEYNSVRIISSTHKLNEDIGDFARWVGNQHIDGKEPGEFWSYRVDQFGAYAHASPASKRAGCCVIPVRRNKGVRLEGSVDVGNHAKICNW